MGDLIGMGSLDHKNFGVLHPQFLRARSATGILSPTENYRQSSYSIRTVKDWNALPQSVVYVSRPFSTV